MKFYLKFKFKNQELFMKSVNQYSSIQTDYGGYQASMKAPSNFGPGLLDSADNERQSYATASAVLKGDISPSDMDSGLKRSENKLSQGINDKLSPFDQQSITPDFQPPVHIMKPNTSRKRNGHEVFIPTAEFNNEEEATEGSQDQEQSSFDVVLRRVSKEDSNLMANCNMIQTGKAYSQNIDETQQSQQQVSKEAEGQSETAGSMITELYSWGSDKHGQLGLGEKFAQGKQVYPFPKCCSYNIAISKIACGDDHTVFITTDCFVYSMGANSCGQLGINDPQTIIKYSPVLIEVLINKRPQDVACGSKHSMVLCEGLSRSSKQPHGEVYAWGDNEFGQTAGGGSAISSIDIVYSPRLVNLETYYRPSIVKIDCGAKHSAFIDDIGRLFLCGANNFGQLGIGSFTSQSAPVHVESITETVFSVACGAQHSVALSNKGKIWVMGSNKNGELGIGRKYDDQSSPVFMKELSFTKVKQVRSGSFTAALSDEHQLYVWGRGAFGDFYTPHRVKSFKNYKIKDFQISTGGTSLVLTMEGDVYAWGSNNYGQLGLNDFQMREKPQKIELLDQRKVNQIALGKHFSIALGETVCNDQESKNGETDRSPSALSGASSGVIIRQESSLFSIDQHPRKARREDSTDTLTHKRPKSKSKKKLHKQESSNFGRGDASPSPRVLKCHLKHAPKNAAWSKIEKPKSYNNLHEGLRIMAKQMKRKSKSSNKLSSVPAAAQIQQRHERESNHSKHSRQINERANYQRLETDSGEYHDLNCQPQGLQHLQINVSKPKSRNVDDKKHEESLRRVEELKMKVEEDKEHAKVCSLVLSESETTFRGNKIAPNQCHVVLGGVKASLDTEEPRFPEKPSSRFDGEAKAQFFGSDVAQESRNGFIKVQDLTVKEHGDGLPFAPSQYFYRSELAAHQGYKEDTGPKTNQRSRTDSANAYSKLDEVSRRTEEMASPKSLYQTKIKTLIREKESLEEDYQRSETHNKRLEAENEKLKLKLETQTKQCKSKHSGLEVQQKEMHYELDRLRQGNADLEERLDQQRAVKENLRSKIKELEGMFDGLTNKKNKAQSELREAIEESASFREDVSYLTKETEALLDDLMKEQKQRKTAEQQLKQLREDLRNSQQQMEDELQQLDNLKSKQDLLQQENDNQCCLLGQMREEKQNLLNMLNTERDELHEAKLQLREFQDSVPKRIEADKQEIEALKDQNEIYARDILDLRKSVTQFAKQSHEQQNDLDDQRKQEKVLRFEKDTLEEQLRSLKNEVNGFNFTITELRDENRRLTTKLSNEIISKAGTYAQNTLSILKSRQSQSQLSSHTQSLQRLPLESGIDVRKNVSHNSSVMVEFQNRRHTGQEDAASHFGSTIVENSGLSSQVYKQKSQSPTYGYTQDQLSTKQEEYTKKPNYLPEHYNYTKSEMQNSYNFRDEPKRAEFAPSLRTEKPNLPRAVHDYSFDAIKQEDEKSQTSGLRYPNYHRNPVPTRGAQSTSPGGRGGVYGLGLHYQNSTYETEKKLQNLSEPASRFQSAEPSARGPRSTLKTSRSGGIDSLLKARYEREKGLQNDKVKDQEAELAVEERLAASQVVRASLADLKSRLNEMRAERVLQKATDKSLVQEEEGRYIDPCRQAAELRYIRFDEQF